jgi:hypothetical protein
VVVLLERHHGEIPIVHVDELGLEILAIGCSGGDRRKIDFSDRPLRRRSLQLGDDQATARRLRQQAIGKILVALVLDHDRRPLAIGREGDGIGLTAERQPGHDLTIGSADHHEVAGRLGEARGSIDGHQHPGLPNDQARRLAADVERSLSDRRAGRADVDEADLPARGVRIDELALVEAEVDDLGDRGAVARDDVEGREMAKDTDRLRGLLRHAFGRGGRNERRDRSDERRRSKPDRGKMGTAHAEASWSRVVESDPM